MRGVARKLRLAIPRSLNFLDFNENLSHLLKVRSLVLDGSLEEMGYILQKKRNDRNRNNSENRRNFGK